MMMETEVDSDTDTVEEYEERTNIYEEVLNNENYRERNNHSKLSTTSSIYRASWWGWPGPTETNNSTFQVDNLKKAAILVSPAVRHVKKTNYFQ